MTRYIKSGSLYGKLMLIIGLLVATPALVLPFYPEDAIFALPFLAPSLTSIALGIVVCVLTPVREDSATVWQSQLERSSIPIMFAWCYAFLAGAVPYILGGQLTFIHAFFESVSGWTTTGLTLVDVPSTPHIFLFYRSFMQCCGGLGFVIMIVLIGENKMSMNLFNAEGHPDRIMPSLKGTARAIILIYISLLALGTLLYCIFGMSFFDALCHSMSALSTAGFSTKAGSIGEYGSLSIEIITVVLMLIGATNFAVLLLIFKRKIQKLIHISEIRFMFVLILVLVLPIALSLAAKTGAGLGQSIRDALFGIITILSTTGYAITDYSQWPPFALGILMVLMIIGGSIGSTAGGIKLLRAYLLIRITRENIRNRMSPKRNVSIPVYQSVQGKLPIDDTVARNTTGFITCYIGVLILGTLLLTIAADCSLFDAMFEFTSILCTVGISNGLTSINSPTGVFIIEIVGMILGRLEIFIVFIGTYSLVRSSGRLIKKTTKQLLRR